MRPASRDDIFTLTREIPRGRVCTFGDLARLSGNPRAARQVGWALSLIPEGQDVPWWRVVKREGLLPFHNHRELQATLLRAEGVEVDEEGRLDLERYRWDGDEAED